MTPHISGSSLSAQARYAAGTREILECYFARKPIRNEYLIVQGGKLAGVGAHSYSAGNATRGSEEAAKFKKREAQRLTTRRHLWSRIAAAKRSRRRRPTPCRAVGGVVFVSEGNFVRVGTLSNTSGWGTVDRPRQITKAISGRGAWREAERTWGANHRSRPSRQSAASSRRRIQPLARAARGARDPPVHRHGVRLQRVLDSAGPPSAWRTARRATRTGDAHDAASLIFGTPRRACDWTHADLVWMFTLFFVFLGSSAALSRRLARARRSAQGGRLCGVLLERRLLHLGARRVPAPDLAHVARLRRHRRHRPRPRLHLARLDADQVVSRIGAAWRRAWRSWASAAAR